MCYNEYSNKKQNKVVVEIKKYYDPEYGKIVDEEYIQNQYKWFENKGIEKTYEQFRADNFQELRRK